MGIFELSRQLLDKGIKGGPSSRRLEIPLKDGELYIFDEEKLTEISKRQPDKAAAGSPRPINGAYKSFPGGKADVLEATVAQPVQPEKTEVSLQRGGVFENPVTGEKIRVEGITEKKGERDISFTEYNRSEKHT